jgi:hypothetical protein
VPRAAWRASPGAPGRRPIRRLRPGGPCSPQGSQASRRGEGPGGGRSTREGGVREFVASAESIRRAASSFESLWRRHRASKLRLSRPARRARRGLAVTPAGDFAAQQPGTSSRTTPALRHHTLGCPDYVIGISGSHPYDGPTTTPYPTEPHPTAPHRARSPWPALRPGRRLGTATRGATTCDVRGAFPHRIRSELLVGRVGGAESARSRSCGPSDRCHVLAGRVSSRRIPRDFGRRSPAARRGPQLLTKIAQTVPKIRNGPYGT